MNLDMPKEYESITPAGHKIMGSYNPITEQFECHIYHKQSGNKIPLSDEIIGGITAAMRADAVAMDAETQSDEWHKTIHDLKVKQSRYLRELAGAAADMIVDRSH